MTTLRLVLLGASLLGILTTLPLWLSSRAVPLLPIASGFPSIPSPWDKVFFGLLLFLLAAACRFYRGAILCFLGGILLLYLCDQNRGQPWMYIYWVMLLLTLLPERIALAGCRLVLSATYVWCAIQKCNPAFFQTIPPFFARPAMDWGLPAEMVTILRWLVASGPVMELLIGIGFWSRRFRRLAVGAAVLMHITVLVLLGPAGQDCNRAIWPWNVAMAALVITLFGNARLKEAWTNLHRSSLAVGIVALVWLLPVLSFLGRWDSYFSFSLYSANLATADICMSQALRDRLPPRLQQHVYCVVQSYDPAWQGPFVFDYHGWSMAELGAPVLPEPRSYRALFRHLGAYAANEAELRMVVVPRGGPVTFHQGQAERKLAFHSGSSARRGQPSHP